MAQYAHPEVLVDTDWLAGKLNDPAVRIVEVDVDTNAYDLGHIPGAIAWAWNTQLCDTVRRDILPKGELEALLSKSGITPDTTIVLYGDSNNWFAAWAFWQLKMYGHKDVGMMNGGRKKWLADGEEVSDKGRSVKPLSTRPRAGSFSESISSASSGSTYGKFCIADRRAQPAGIHRRDSGPSRIPETCQRGGHIPGARNVPWGKACNDDGTFKSFDELKALYGVKGSGVEARRLRTAASESVRANVVCSEVFARLGNVTNYDGSWTEWGNLVGAPVERGAAKPVGA